jgi:hypothetical protein
LVYIYDVTFQIADKSKSFATHSAHNKKKPVFSNIS